MKGHLEIFEHRLKDMASKLPQCKDLDIDALFLEFEQALGDRIAYYDVHSGATLADYYATTFMQFAKSKAKAQ